MSACVFPGSFDPITRGHLNLIERAARLYDSVTVTVMVNISKTGIFPYEERVQLIRKACRGIPNVRAELWKGLLSDYMREHPGSVVLRCVRNTEEFEQEMNARRRTPWSSRMPASPTSSSAARRPISASDARPRHSATTP